MSALTVDHSSHGYGGDDLVRIREETDAPEGCRVEIIEGIITVSPPPSNNHNDIADEVHRALYPVIPRTGAFTRRSAPLFPREAACTSLIWPSCPRRFYEARAGTSSRPPERS